MVFQDARQILAALLREHGESKNTAVAEHRSLTKGSHWQPDRKDFPLLQGKSTCTGGDRWLGWAGIYRSFAL